ncbi:hypothetical protein ABID42_000821 [Arcicella rosea]
MKKYPAILVFINVTYSEKIFFVKIQTKADENPTFHINIHSESEY